MILETTLKKYQIEKKLQEEELVTAEHIGEFWIKKKNDSWNIEIIVVGGAHRTSFLWNAVVEDNLVNLKRKKTFGEVVFFVLLLIGSIPSPIILLGIISQIISLITTGVIMEGFLFVLIFALFIVALWYVYYKVFRVKSVDWICDFFENYVFEDEVEYR